MLLTDESPRIADFLRTKWAFSPGLMAITMVMPFLGVLSRLETLIPDATFLTGAIASVVPSLCGFLFFVGIGAQGVRRLTTSTPTYFPVLLWALTGLVVAIAVVRPGLTAAIARMVASWVRSTNSCTSSATSPHKKVALVSP